MFTLNVYTNTVAAGDGGRTRFYPEGVGPSTAAQEALADVAVAPEAGLCCCFRQPPAAFLLHDGEELRGGVKYLLRSDVMYRRVETQIVEGAPSATGGQG